ncbi:MAG: cytochrome bc complex cytochrome b subunit [Candidatus Omnitrophota bacterium]|nr:cytochrome bc complex cytochrome b subunit [Candidatus Omnitrophota bacterium]
MWKRCYHWFNERFDLPKIQKPINDQLTKPLPGHISWFHTLGSMSFFLFISQVLTGILLLIYYHPTQKEAFESIKFITNEVYMGWLYRQIHAWGSNLMIIIVFLHMLRTFVTGSYKKPREITWILGVLLFVMTVIFGFTGYLLPWNQLAYWATTVGTEIAGAVPFFGEFLKTFLRGGTAVGGETLSRFFVIHVIILPWALFFIVIFHLFCVRYLGMSTMDKVGEEKKVKEGQGVPFFPHHVLKEGIVLFVLLGVLITLSVFSPFELGEKANPLQTPHAIKPEWYFLSMYQVLKHFPKSIGIFVLGLAPLFLLIWPFLDRTPQRHPSKRPVSMTIGILVVLSLVIFGVLGWVSETRIHVFGKTYDVDMYGKPHLVPAQTPPVQKDIAP